MKSSVLGLALVSCAATKSMYAENATELQRRLLTAPGAMLTGTADALATQQIYKGSTYTYVSTPYSWDEAALHCRDLGGDLVSIHDEAEGNLTSALAYDGSGVFKDVWIGLTNEAKWTVTAKKWVWADGSTVDYLSWHPGEPNGWAAGEHCAVGYAAPLDHSHHGNWNDDTCSKKKSSVCKLPWAGLVYEGATYRYIPEHKTWGAASANCKSLGGELASIHSPEQNNMTGE
jgi:hypothetical protein